MRLASVILVFLTVLASSVSASVDTLSAEVHEGDFTEDRELYELDFGAGCSLACGIGWIFDSTSELAPQSDFTYEAGNLGDADWSTAWVEGVPGYGEGEAVMAVFCYGPDEDSVPFRGLTIQNGYAKSEAAWENNGRVHLIEMRLNGTPLYMIELADSMQPQSVHWSDDIPVGNGDLLELVIVSAYPGLRYQDTSLTELIFWGAH